MKKFLIAAAASLLLLGGCNSTEAADYDLNEPTVQTQEVSKWPQIRDSLLGRDRRHHDHHHDRHDYHDRHHHRQPPPPPPHRFPPPPPHR